jgi:hypothetical protein
MLQVFGPQPTLIAHGSAPQTTLLQLSPGDTQIPQLSLQQTFPALHMTEPQAAPISKASSGVASTATDSPETTGTESVCAST